MMQVYNLFTCSSTHSKGHHTDLGASKQLVENTCTHTCANAYNRASTNSHAKFNASAIAHLRKANASFPGNGPSDCERLLSQQAHSGGRCHFRGIQTARS